MEPEKIDKFLDSALSEYSEASPRDGLEQRILAGLTAAERNPRSNWRWVWVAVPVVALVVVLLMHLPRRRPPEIAHDRSISTEQVKKHVGGEVVAPVVAKASRPAMKNRHRANAAVSEVKVAARESAEPRLERFPSPDNDEQARLLLRFVTRNPDTAKEVVKEQEEFQQVALAKTRMETERE